MGMPERKVSEPDLRYVRSGRPLPPRMRNALRLYVTGAVATKRDAGRIAGIGYDKLSEFNRNPLVNAEIAKIHKQIDDNVVDMSNAIRALGRLGVAKIAELMESSKKEEIQLKAAQDLADRSPETSKTQKVSLEADITLPAVAVADLAKALLEQASRRDKYVEAAQGDYIKVNEAVPLALPAPQENK